MELKENPELFALRHSLAHILAQAVQKLFPNVKLGFGPPVETGFYYDFDFGADAPKEKDLKKIEKVMKKIISQNQEFKKNVATFEQALSKVESLQEPYKIENIRSLKEKGINSFSFYENGRFIDLCEGPHVENTKNIPLNAFKLDRIAGAYWLGDEKNVMLTRIYGLAFLKEEELEDFIKRREIAQQFDHKKLGKELEIFYFDDKIGKGLPLWLPNGTIIRDKIEDYAKEMEEKAGYKRVSTPILAKDELYRTSQHLPAYEESMYPPILCENEETKHQEKYYLRPMNCPHHHLIFKHRNRSYRELPLRLAEYGTTFRFEQSGELSGLIRVRGMTLNDAHIYCSVKQIKKETQDILKLYQQMYETFKLSDYFFRLSLREEGNHSKYKGSNEMWDNAEKILTQVLDESKIPYCVAKGEAAFYGPKIDIQFKNLMGREETVSTIQLDFLGPMNFDLKYTNEQGDEETPVIIHRAPLSTHERFISFLLEYYRGAFPTWLAPIQVVIIPINPSCTDYCNTLYASLKDQNIRVELDESNNSFSKKVRTNTMRKIPMLLIVGNQEVTDKSVNLRRYGSKEQISMSKNEFVETLLMEIKERKNYIKPQSGII